MGSPEHVHSHPGAIPNHSHDSGQILFTPLSFLPILGNKDSKLGITVVFLSYRRSPSRGSSGRTLGFSAPEKSKHYF